ncbi:hypothetical protein Vadar_022857 [Vaccinium darrowii]|uniref:Uncharacterized protein n=1 Tax=Vaccinium darrowii TaxID=229202 RepID=A0ACB7Y8H0_9ERIC|nr:hypothetical protein Vadar_022857 [Vaccinium darrowii]
MGSPQNLPSNGSNAALPPNPKGKKRKQRHSTPNFASNDKDTELSPDSNSCKRRRGSTFLPDVIKDRSSGERREVHYNKRGQTIGETKPKYSSWLGVLARTMVPIDREWKEVTNENKNKLWECVQMSFKVDPRSKKKVLSNIATSCRTFRKALTTYIRKHESDPDILSRPPPNYSFLDQNQWDAFVKHRQTEDFQKLSDANRERQSKNIYPCRLSRKGYAVLEQEQLNMRKESNEGAEDEGAEDEGAKDEVTEGVDTEDIDRSVLWKLARQNKNGEYDDEGIKEQAARIDEVTRRSREGSLPIGGSNDILALALDKREHSGRVRAAGEFVTPTAYFHMPRRTRRSIHSSCEEKFKTLVTAMSNKESRVNECEQVPHTPHHTMEDSMKSHDIGNPQFSLVTTEDIMRTRDDMPLDPKSKVKQSQPCRLAVGSPDNIVALGKMFEKVGPEEVVHTVPLGDANVRVYIDFVIKKDAILPVPIAGEVYIVGEATGYYVAWPKNLVLLGDEAASKKQGVSSNIMKSNNIGSPQFKPVTVEDNMRTRNDMPPNPKSKVRKSQPCRLAVGSLDNIVAHGEMFEKVGPEEVVHTVPLGDAYVRVYIDFVIKKDAILPVPIAGEVSIVGEATGYYVAWPKNLVLLGDEGGLKNHGVTGNKGASKDLGVTVNKGAAQTYTPRWDDNQVIFGNVDCDEYLESLRSFNDYVGSLEYSDAYTISVDEDVFGAKVEVPLVKEDMEYMSQMEEVTVSCITFTSDCPSCFSHLCRVMKSANIGRRFNFVNPSAIFGTSIKLAGRSKSNLLASLLKDVENDKLVFVPYNLGVHWILLVIDLSSSTIHYLDSLQPEKIQPNIQVIFAAAMRIYDSSKSIPRKRSLTWINVKCPRQPTNVECGFYVMRYMKDLIADESILSKKNFNGKTTYTQAEIDEVRVEWMNCVLEYDI